MSYDNGRWRSFQKEHLKKNKCGGSKMKDKNDFDSRNVTVDREDTLDFTIRLKQKNIEDIDCLISWIDSNIGLALIDGKDKIEQFKDYTELKIYIMFRKDE